MADVKADWYREHRKLRRGRMIKLCWDAVFLGIGLVLCFASIVLFGDFNSFIWWLLSAGMVAYGIIYVAMIRTGRESLRAMDRHLETKKEMDQYLRDLSDRSATLGNAKSP